MCIKKTSTKLSKPSNPSLGKRKSISSIFVFYSLYFTSYCYPNTAVVVKGYCKCTSISLVSQGHKDFDHNENNSIYSKAMRLTGK